MDYKLISSLKCDQGAVRKVRFNIDGMYCITCGSDKTLKLWNPHRGLFLKSYSGHGSDVMDACGSSDSSQLLSGGTDRAVMTWDVPTGKVLRRFRVHVSTVSCVKFNEESTLAFSGSLDNAVHIWDLKAHNFQPIQTLKDAKDAITSILVTDHEIVTASLDCQIRRYDLRNGSLTTDYTGAPIVSAAMTQDGQCYVIGTDNSRLALFDKSSGELLNEYSGHQIGNYLIEVGVDRKDKTLLSGSTDGSVYCWDLIGSSVLCKLQHDANSVVHSLATHPTSAFLVTATQSQVHLWGEEELALEES
ncbi:unnamed protein product [Nesidiocoris tenuis]|uniref:WD repeat domain-containing protein 83 n=2 Tax=Nesidiocoris tenuis TaxID=355587 RepID=A0A6H5HQZ1_9HEMI|nr:WD domain, G-beta repeat [Nesidiocoris tenuis]CAB0020024.1 unnamed protein product [Nesidiocoris tenuis]